jgi:predicted metal-dependent phosphoesterase TrpH
VKQTPREEGIAVGNQPERFVDLHVHTSYSDGTFAPAQVVSRASDIGLSAVGITDHDTTDGVAAAVSAGAKLGVEVVPGVELSAELRDSSEEEIHILGYFIDWEQPALQQRLKVFREARADRARRIFQQLADLGIRLREEAFFGDGRRGVIGRLHFAKEMLAEKYVPDIKSAFNLYLSLGRPAYVPKFKLDPRDGIGLIRGAGGVAVLAHPFVSISSDARIIRRLVNDGLQGIEVYHTKHNRHITEELLAIADKYELAVTGGSDCHGELISGTPLLGCLQVPYHVLEQLKACRRCAVTGVRRR